MVPMIQVLNTYPRPGQEPENITHLSLVSGLAVGYWQP